jgi:hypothetical protein
LAVGDASGETMLSLPGAPPVVSAGNDAVDLLVASLPYVGHPHVSGDRVDGEAEGISEPVRIRGRLAASCLPGISVRDCVGGSVVDVDAQKFGEEPGLLLAVTVLVVGAAAVAEGRIEEAIGTEVQVAAIVIGGRLVEGRNQRDRVAEGGPVVRAGHSDEGRAHARGAAVRRVRDVHVAVGGEARVEGHPQEASFTGGVDRAGQRGHDGFGGRVGGGKRYDLPRALGCEEARLVVGELREHHRTEQGNARESACKLHGRAAGGARGREAGRVRGPHVESVRSDHGRFCCIAFGVARCIGSGGVECARVERARIARRRRVRRIRGGRGVRRFDGGLGLASTGGEEGGSEEHRERQQAERMRTS